MIPSDSSFRFHRSLLALSLVAAFLPLQAHAEGDDAAPITSVSFGLGLQSGSSADHAQFGQYNGLRADRNFFGNLGFSHSLRDTEKSNWLQIEGSNLLGETRELSLVKKDPGNWRLSAAYGELVRYEPNTVNSGLLGAGSSTPQVVALAAGSGSDLELKTKRSALGLGFSKTINPALQFDLDLKSENRDGARLSGVGINCPTVIAPGCLGTTLANTGWASLMLPEPVSANHSQVEARLTYGAEKLRFNLGYYGSFYRNNNGNLTGNIPGSLYNPVGSLLPLSTGLRAVLGQPVALAPDNQAHQLDLSGSYDLGSATRATFKLARSVATQNADFAAAGLTGAPAGVNNLDGQVRNSLAKLSLSSRPVRQLSLLADLRYEKKDDQTPLATYNIEGAVPALPALPFTYTNRNLSSQKGNAKLQASWQLSSDYRATLGADRETIDRGEFTASSAISGISALRQKTNENTVRAELRGRLAETLTGSVAISRSKRDGSNWLKDNSGLGVTEVINPADPVTGLLPTSVFMPTLSDRQRNKVKLFADWQASEALSLQISAESGSDRYTTPSSYGLRDTGVHQFSLDWAYTLSDNWGLTGAFSSSQQSLNQARAAAYLMAFDNSNLGASIGANGKINAKLDVGGSLSYAGDKSVYGQTLDSLAGSDSVALLAATGGLPDILYSQTALKLFGKYALEKGSSVRVDFVHQRNNVNDWTWSLNGVPYVYSDGSTVLQKANQSVNVIGVTYVYQLP
jgi:MtrB/PioB family decaheme-associated outer membrane protein